MESLKEPGAHVAKVMLDQHQFINENQLLIGLEAPFQEGIDSKYQVTFFEILVDSIFVF